MAAVPFRNAEDAWLWFARCQQLRRDGVRFRSSGSRRERPCDPDDIYCAAAGLHRAGRLSRLHLRVLAVYGLHERAPDPRCRDETAAARLWHEALDRLEPVLLAKRIVEPPA